MLSREEQASLVRDDGPFRFVEGTDVWLPQSDGAAVEPLYPRLGVVTKRWRDRTAPAGGTPAFGPVRCFVEVPDPSGAGRVYLDFPEDALWEAAALAACYLQVLGPAPTAEALSFLPHATPTPASAVLSSAEVEAVLGFPVPDGWYAAIVRSS